MANERPQDERPEERGEGPTGQEESPFLLDRLMYKGVLPKYAFPTDVVSFYVFDPGRSNYRKTVYKYSPSQALAVALSQYAPGKEITIDSQVFSSSAIYSPTPGQREAAWDNRKFYSQCEQCGFAIRTDETTSGSLGVCPSCQSSGSFGQPNVWLRPPGFAHPVNQPNQNVRDMPARSHTTNAKLEAPSPEASLWKVVSDRVRIHHFRPHLVVTNRGPKNEGYNYCIKCGLIEPAISQMRQTLSSHEKPFPDQRGQTCRGGVTSRGIVLGTDFITDVLLISVQIDRPLQLNPASLATRIAMKSICAALSRASCELLELEIGEIAAEYRLALTPAGQSAQEYEVFLYDTLAGGAGFSRRAGELQSKVFSKARELLLACDCDSSCYRCLRSFRNRFEHSYLDRKLALSLLDYMIEGKVPVLDKGSLERWLALLAADTVRVMGGLSKAILLESTIVPGIGQVTLPLNVTSPSGNSVVVDLYHPLTPGVHSQSALADLEEYSSRQVLLVDSLLVRKNLPRGTQSVLSTLGYSPDSIV